MITDGMIAARENHAARNEIKVMQTLDNHPSPLYALSARTGVPVRTLRDVLVRLRQAGVVQCIKRIWSVIEL